MIDAIILVAIVALFFGGIYLLWRETSDALRQWRS